MARPGFWARPGPGTLPTGVKARWSGVELRLFCALHTGTANSAAAKVGNVQNRKSKFGLIEAPEDNKSLNHK